MTMRLPATACRKARSTLFAGAARTGEPGDRNRIAFALRQCREVGARRPPHLVPVHPTLPAMPGLLIALTVPITGMRAVIRRSSGVMTWRETAPTTSALTPWSAAQALICARWTSSCE